MSSLNFPSTRPINPVESVRTFAGLQEQQERFRVAEDKRRKEAIASDLQARTNQALSQSLSDDPNQAAFGFDALKQINPGVAMKVDEFYRQKKAAKMRGLESEQRLETGEISQRKLGVETRGAELGLIDKENSSKYKALSMGKNAFNEALKLPQAERRSFFEKHGIEYPDDATFSDEEIKSNVGEISTQQRIITGPPVFDPETPGGKAVKELQWFLDNDPNSRLTKHMQDNVDKITTKAGPSQIFNLGPNAKDQKIAATRASINALQNDIIFQTGMGAALDDVKELIPELGDQLTYLGKAYGTALSIADRFKKLGPGKGKEFLAKRDQLIQRSGVVFNIFRRLITGAAAPAQELEKLKKMILNPDMNPSTFETNFNELLRQTRRAARISHNLMRGFTGDIDQYKRDFDSAWEGQQQMDSLPLAATRASEFYGRLISRGAGDLEARQKALNQLVSEGYFDSLGAIDGKALNFIGSMMESPE